VSATSPPLSVVQIAGGAVGQPRVGAAAASAGMLILDR
jgi:hypothetical protein